MTFGPGRASSQSSRVTEQAGRIGALSGRPTFLRANAYAELRELAELLGAPVSTSLEGKSCFDETHPLAIGSGGAAIPGQLRHFLHNADLIFGIGCSFSETAFGVSMPSHVPIIHSTLDPVDFNKGVRCEMVPAVDQSLIHPRREARTTAWVLSRAPSFWNRVFSRPLMVFSDRSSDQAICLF